MEKITIRRGELSEDEIDVLCGEISILSNSVDILLYVVEAHYRAEYMASKEYRELVRLYGTIEAQKILNEQLRNLIRLDDRKNVHDLLKQIEKVLRMVYALIEKATAAHHDGISDVQSFDGIHYDSNFVVYLYTLIANCDEDANMKILNFVKSLAKEGRVSTTLLDNLGSRLGINH
ncbi:MAG: hypothetical protein IKO26_07930 [Paludibacteraceae bacterium]|nr:hypothetical protein [Paludibacteraceae bacterium]